MGLLRLRERKGKDAKHSGSAAQQARRTQNFHLAGRWLPGYLLLADFRTT